ncbi:hypothetical protein [Gilliamella sp.]
MLWECSFQLWGKTDS